MIYREYRMNNRVRYTIEGLDCPTCAIEIEKDISKMEGVESAQLNYMSKKLDIVSNKIIDKKKLNSIAKQHERNANIKEETSSLIESEEKKYHPYIIPIRVGLSIILILLNYVFISSFPLSLILYISAYLLSGYDVLYTALRNMAKGKFFDEQFLMSIATIGAFLIKEYPEATAVMAFYQIGEYFQSRAVDHSRKSVSSLVKLKPTYALVKRVGELVQIRVEEVLVDDIVVIKPGMNVPVDIIVTSGSSDIDERSITGESKPVSVEKGSTILSGSINGNGVIEGIALKDYENSTVAILIHLVEDAGMKKAKTERFISRFSAYYTPIVVFSALFVAFVIPSITSTPYSPWIYRALVFLVVSCPCALVLSVPLGIFAGIGQLARQGVLVKGGNYLEAMSKIDSIVFDKTGTITTGELKVETIIVTKESTYDSEKILYYAASLESFTHHVIAKAVCASYEGKVSTHVTDIQEFPGKGITGVVDGKRVSVTNHTFVDEMDILHEHDLLLEKDNHLFVSIDNLLVATIMLSDTIKNEAIETVSELKKRGTTNITLLSGDSEEAVKNVARETKIEKYHYRKLPHEKLEIVEQLIANKKRGSHVLFVGDGINDAPVLRMSDVGISMGKMGSDAAIESSDIVIMKDDISKIVDSIDVSKKTMSIIRQNITLAISIKIGVMILSLFSISTLWMAVFADTGVALLAVANSMRILMKKRK
ncbi:MAG: cadmium-translocating P-type ATPase [Spirochaetia bacterium]|nr:cadmium-translocating P-type ATPase [Spirochaetia bacterium]